MKNLVIFSTLFCLSAAISAQDIWNSFYQNYELNESGQFTRNFIEFGPDGALYLAETDYNNDLIYVKRYDNGEWTLLGEGLPRNMGQWSKFDFVVAPDGEIYLGNDDHIYHYNSNADSWSEYEVIGYIGGLTAGSDGTIYFIHLENLELASYNTSIASFDNGSVTLLQPLFEGSIIAPAKFRELNQIIEQDGEFYVSFSRQSNNSIHVFTGNLTDGFTVLEESALIPEFNTHNSSLFAGVASGSMAVGPEGEITISLSATNGIVLKRHNPETDAWDDLPQTGINSQSAHFNHLRYDNEGVLHLIYDGSQSEGFVFRYSESESEWEHIGPLYVGLSTFDTNVRAPHMAFDEENNLCFVHGIGSMLISLHIRKLDEGMWVNEVTEKVRLSLYPNPATSLVNVNIDGFDHPADRQLTLHDAQGRKVQTINLTPGMKFFDVSGLTAGWYIIQLSNREGTVIASEKLLIGGH